MDLHPVGPAQAPADIRNDEAQLDPDDPLLARAQEALKRQLKETQQRVQEELREKTKLLSDAKQRKEDLGVNLFNFQQQLATLQMELEKSHETHTKVAAQKDTIAQRVQEVNTQHDDEMNLHQGEKLRADNLQEELDRCVSRPEPVCEGDGVLMWRVLQTSCYSAPNRGLSYFNEARNCCHAPGHLQSRRVHSESGEGKRAAGHAH